MMADKWVALVHTLLDVKSDAPVDLIPYHSLRRASAPERDWFRATLDRGAVGGSLRFESIVTAQGMRRTPDPDKWRYWVIAVDDRHDGQMNGLILLEELSRLTDVELRFYLHRAAGKLGDVPIITGSDHSQDDYAIGPQPFTEDLVQLIHDLDVRVQGVESSYRHIRRAISMYSQLADTKASQLYVLGVFGVIESVLTHDPEGKQSSSLTHQVWTKMNLLNSRFAVPLDDSAFGGCGFEKLWKLLYHFRSCLAHGSDPDFSKELKALKDFGAARAFIDQAAKKLLRQALAEPRLMTDLQRC